MAWQPIETAPKDGRDWQVSSNGEVSVNGIIRKQHTSNKGYRKITMGEKTVSVHRLVAMAFAPNPENYKEVNHIDGDKLNNTAANLEWCSRSQNMKHAYSVGLHSGVSLLGQRNPNWGRRGKLHSQSMAVRATFPDGTVKDYESQGMAGRDGYSAHKISQCINGVNKTHRGATWQPLPAPPEN